MKKKISFEKDILEFFGFPPLRIDILNDFD